MSNHNLLYERNLGFFSDEEQDKLNRSSVAIAGAGGDGGMLAIQLARMGVGSIKLADPDPFEFENINRQACANHDTVGRNKAEVVGEAIGRINPDIDIQVFTEGVSRDNVERFTEGADLLIDETEFTLHALGVMLARSARNRAIPNLMAMNIGFGSTVTTFHPKGKTFEATLGLSEDASLDEIADKKVDIKSWLPYIPPYVDLQAFKVVASGEKSAPSVSPGVALASSIGATQSFLNLVHDLGNNRPEPVYAPRLLMMDAMTGESKFIRHPKFSTYMYFAKLALNNALRRNPKVSY